MFNLTRQFFPCFYATSCAQTISRQKCSHLLTWFFHVFTRQFFPFFESWKTCCFPHEVCCMMFSASQLFLSNHVVFKKKKIVCDALTDYLEYNTNKLQLVLANPIRIGSSVIGLVNGKYSLWWARGSIQFKSLDQNYNWTNSIGVILNCTTMW